MKRRYKLSILVLVLAAAGVTTYYAWPRPRPVETTRSARLLTIAAEEAGGITELDDRLTRQLNIADLQIQCNQKGEAVKTLALAVATLKTPETATTGPATGKAADKPTMDDFRRIAGWTSVAELAHRAGDEKTATDAYIDAVEALNSVQPEARRAEYVLSLAEICYTLRGQKEAAQLLVKGGTWASKIENTIVRRFALATFARQLASYDDLENARAVMRNELDARWRSDTFAALARQEMFAEDEQRRLASANGNGFLGNKSTAAAGVAEKTRAAESGKYADVAGFNRNLHYESNYRDDNIQHGLLPR